MPTLPAEVWWKHISQSHIWPFHNLITEFGFRYLIAQHVIYKFTTHSGLWFVTIL